MKLQQIKSQNMALNLRRPSSKDKNVVGLFKPDGFCKKHPKHRQSPGVCSLCLCHKLSQISSTSKKNKKSSSSVIALNSNSSSSSVSSISSYCSSSDSSYCGSPMHPLPIFLFNAKHGGLVKSKSVAVVSRTRRRSNGVDDLNYNNKKKNGFWFKLLHPKSKRIDDKGINLIHSKSLREAIAVAS